MRLSTNSSELHYCRRINHQLYQVQDALVFGPSAFATGKWPSSVIFAQVTLAVVSIIANLATRDQAFFASSLAFDTYGKEKWNILLLNYKFMKFIIQLWSDDAKNRFYK